MTTTAMQAADLQSRVQPWLLACFGAEISRDKIERNHRFLEEALELVQACGCTGSEAHQLVDYVFGRTVGEPSQEAGGVMITLAALCLAQDMDMHEAGETELRRIWMKVDQIRAKQAAKPRHSPLPVATRDREMTAPTTPLSAGVSETRIAKLEAALRDVRDGLRAQAVGRMEWRVARENGAYCISDSQEHAIDKWIADHQRYCEREGYRKVHVRYLSPNENYMRATADFIDAALNEQHAEQDQPC
jgi:hypothetical protein